MKKILFIFFTSSYFLSASQTQMLQWAKQLSGFGNTMVNPTSITVDKSGNVYSAGKYKWIADFNPGAGTYTLPANAYENTYVSKLDAQGNFVWASSFYGGVSTPFTPVINSIANAVAVDTNGNVFTTGQFLGTVDFDPGPSVYSLSSGTEVAMFVSKLDAMGNFVWAKKIGGVSGDTGSDVVVDANGNCHITGTFSNSIFVAKLDPAGSITWSVTFGNGGKGAAIALDNNGSVYTTGLSSSGDYDPGPATYSLNAQTLSLFISKLSVNGTFIWAGLQTGAGVINNGMDIEVDASGNMYVLDWMMSYLGGYATDMDPGPGTYTIVPIGSGNNAISKFGPNGNFLWAKNIISGAPSYKFALDQYANVHSCGVFNSTVDFDPGPGTFSLAPVSSPSPFILTLNTSGNFVHVQQDSNYLQLAMATRDGYLYGTGNSGDSDFNYEPGTFTLTQKSAADAFVFKKVLCNPGANVTAVSDKSVLCLGQTATLMGSGAVTYSWIPGANYASILVTPTITTTYILNTSDVDGCFGTVTFTQQVFDCTSLNDNESIGNASIYPNPSRGQFIYTTNAKVSSIDYELLDARGVTIEKGTRDCIDNIYRFNLNGKYQNGMYLLRVKGNNSNKIFKVILE